MDNTSILSILFTTAISVLMNILFLAFLIRKFWFHFIDGINNKMEPFESKQGISKHNDFKRPSNPNNGKVLYFSGHNDTTDLVDFFYPNEDVLWENRLN